MEQAALHDSYEPQAPGSMTLSDLAAGELHIWAVPLQGDPEPFVAMLSAAERDRASRFHFADHRRRYEITHGALRRILSGYVEVPGEALAFRNGPRGKPFLNGPKLTKDGGPFFSLSHSGKLTLIGVCASELGLDCEKVRHLESYREIAGKHFSECEVAGLEDLDDAARLLAFYRCWTRKEAYIKAIGEGLTMSLDSFDVSIGEVPQFLACRDGREDPAKWSMLDVSPGPEFVAAIAMRGKAPKVRTFRLTAPEAPAV